MARFLYTFIFFLLLCAIAHAQRPTIAWDKTFGTVEWEYFRTITYLEKENSLLIGGTTDIHDASLMQCVLQGFPDNLVLKVDTFGNEMSEDCYGGDGTEDYKAVLIDTSGKYIYYLSETNSDKSGTVSESWRAGLVRNSDFWLLKTDIQGNKIWDKRYGGNSEEEVNAISYAHTPANFIMVGHTISPRSGDIEENERVAGPFIDYWSDFWIVTIDSVGKIVWSKRYGGNRNDIASSVHKLPDGYVVVGGSSSNGDSLIPARLNKTDWDIWAMKISKSGEIIWSKTYGGTGDEALSSLNGEAWGGQSLASQINNSSLHILGTSRSTDGDKTAGYRGGNGCDMWLLEIDINSGSLKREKSFSGKNGYDAARKIRNWPWGGWLLVGQSNSDIGFEKSQKSFGATAFGNEDSDGWLILIDENWNVKWDITLGGKNNEYLMDAEVLPSGSIYTVGWSNSTPSGNKTAPHIGSYDCWLVKLNVEKPFAVDDFKYLNARLLKNSVDISWEMNQVEDGDQFSIEFSAPDIYHFNPCGNISAINKHLAYDYKHNIPPEGNVYYRVVLIKANGEKRYSPVKLVQVYLFAESAYLKLSPNPAKYHLKVEHGFINEGEILLFDLNANEVIHQKVTEKTISTIVNISNLPAGLYSCILNTPNGVLTQKVVIQRD